VSKRKAIHFREQYGANAKYKIIIIVYRYDYKLANIRYYPILSDIISYFPTLCRKSVDNSKIMWYNNRRSIIYNNGG